MPSVQNGGNNKHLEFPFVLNLFLFFKNILNNLHRINISSRCSKKTKEPAVTNVFKKKIEENLKPSEVKKNPALASSLNQLLKREGEGRALVEKMRKDIQAKIHEEKKTGENAEIIGRLSGKNLRALLKKYLVDGEVELKKRGLVKPCEYSCIVFGSTARDDGGAYPDLDYGFVVEKRTREANLYFEALSQYVADRIFRLGESFPGKSPGVHACFGGATPFFKNYGWRHQDNSYVEKLSDKIKRKQKLISRIRLNNPGDPRAGKIRSEINKLKSLHKNQLLLDNELTKKYIRGNSSRTFGTATYIGEPKEMVQWINPSDASVTRKAEKLAKKQGERLVEMEKRIRNLGDYPDILSVDSNPKKVALVEELKKLRKSIILGAPKKKEHLIEKNDGSLVRVTCNNIIQEKFTNVILSNAKSRAKSLPTDKALEVKRDFWRFPQTLIAYLSEMHGIGEMSSFSRIKALKKKGVLSEETANQLNEVYQFLVSLRAKCQLHYQCEFHHVFPSEDIKNKFLYQENKNVDVEIKIKKVKKQIEENSRIKEFLIKNQLQDNGRLSRVLGKERAHLFYQLESLNHQKMLENGLVLTDAERRFLEKRALPILGELEKKAFQYVEKNKWERFG